MHFAIILLNILSISGDLLLTESTSYNDSDLILSTLLDLHNKHCDNTTLCVDENRYRIHVPGLLMFPMPCCIPCLCSPTCRDVKDCCLADLKKSELLSTTAANVTNERQKDPGENERPDVETDTANMTTGKYTLWYDTQITGVVGCGEGVVYLSSPGHPTDIGLQLGKACILVAGKGRGGGGGRFYFFCFFTFIPVPLSSLSLSFFTSTISSISFSPLFWETTQNNPQGLTCC